MHCSGYTHSCFGKSLFPTCTVHDINGVSCGRCPGGPSVEASDVEMLSLDLGHLYTHTLRYP